MASERDAVLLVYDVNAALMLFERTAVGLAGAADRRTEGSGSASATAAPFVPEPYGMVAAFMSLELHERGNHAVSGPPVLSLVMTPVPGALHTRVINELATKEVSHEAGVGL